MQIRVLLVLLIFVAFVANLIAPYVFERYLQFSIPNRMFECLGAFFFGLKFSEISLLGFALAYLPMPRFQRATLVFGLTCLLVLAFMIGLRAWPGMPIQAAILLCIGSLGGVSLVGTIAVVLKRSGWRIQHQDFTLA
jgi:peptidoglycan/LPS O-acetylase OafA/YrhL